MPDVELSYIVQEHIQDRISGVSHVSDVEIVTAWGPAAVKLISSGEWAGHIISSSLESPYFVEGLATQEPDLIRFTSDLIFAQEYLARLGHVHSFVEVEWLVDALGPVILQVQPLPREDVPE